MRPIVLHILMGVMLFCGIESAVDASTVTGHHDEGATHEIHHPESPAPDHNEDDCSHFCHCTAHLPSFAILNDAPEPNGLASGHFCEPAQDYSSRTVAPPLRPPIA